MQQRQLRLGDILDDYCPRERRLTNHVIVAMIGPDVKQTRCTTCEADHEYKNAKVPRLRRKADSPAALYAQVLAGGPKRIVHDPPSDLAEVPAAPSAPAQEPVAPAAVAAASDVVGLESGGGRPATSERSGPGRPGSDDEGDREGSDDRDDREEGPVHRPLIRASLPRVEGQPPPTRPAPEFTIRQPGGRQNRFRPRGAGGQQFQTNRSQGNMGGGPPRGGMPRHGGGRPPQGTQGSPTSHLSKRHGPGRKRSK